MEGVFLFSIPSNKRYLRPQTVFPTPRRSGQKRRRPWHTVHYTNSSRPRSAYLPLKTTAGVFRNVSASKKGNSRSSRALPPLSPRTPRSSAHRINRNIPVHAPPRPVAELAISADRLSSALVARKKTIIVSKRRRKVLPHPLNHNHHRARNTRDRLPRSISLFKRKTLTSPLSPSPFSSPSMTYIVSHRY